MTNPTIQIPKDIIEPIIQANISAAIIDALGNRSNVMAEVIGAILNVKVDEKGQASNYGNNKSWIDWAVGNALRNAAQTAINEAIATQQEVIKQHLISQLSRKNSPLIKQLVEGMMTGVFNASQSQYRLTVTHDTASR